MALTPVILLSICHFVLNEKVGWQVIIGTVLTVAKVAILLLAQ